jgi:adenosine/AMP kinase
MELKVVKPSIPEGCNIILGQTHFIKTAEDLYEIITTSCPHAKFGIAFCEASGPCLVRVEGNDEDLRGAAAENALILGAGHAFAISVLNAVKSCPEVCNIYCATANPVEAIIADTGDGRGILGVVDGAPPKGVETDADVVNRKEFLRKIGYKR